MSAFLDGLVGGASSVQAFGQQQFANKMAREKLDFEKNKFNESTRQFDLNYQLAQDNYKISQDENKRAEAAAPGIREQTRLSNITSQNAIDEEAKKVLIEENDKSIGQLTAAGYINEQAGPLTLDLEQTVANIKVGGAVNDQGILLLANRDPDLPEGFTLDRVERIGNTGMLTISGKYEDGSRGVLTVDGKISKDSEVALMSPDLLARLMDDEYQTNVRLNSNLGASSATVEYLVSTGMAQADAEAVVNRNTAQATLKTQVTGELDNAANDPSTGEGKNVGMVRQFKSLLASAKSDEEQLSILIDQAKTMGIEVPEILVQTPPTVDQEQKEKDAPAPAGNIFERAATEGNKTSDKPRDIAAEKQQLDDQIAQAEKALASAGSPIAKRSATRQLENLKAQRSQLPQEESFSTIPDQSEEAKKAAQALETGIFERINNMTPTEAADFAASNNFELTPQDEQNMATVLEDANVQTAADINKLPTIAQIATRAHLRTMAIARGDNTTAETIRQELLNLGSGSGRADANLADVQKLQIDKQNADSKSITANTGVYNAETSRLNYRNARDRYSMDLEKMDFDQGEEIGEFIITNMQALEKGLYELDSDGSPTSNLKFDEKNLKRAVSSPTGALTQLRRKLDSASPQNKPALRGAVNSVYSMTIQAMAESEKYGTLGEFLPDGSIDFIDGHDRFLARVFVAERDTAGNPSRFGIRSLSSLTQVEETVSASKLKNIFGNQGYADFRQQIGERKNIQDTKINQTGLGK